MRSFDSSLFQAAKTAGKWFFRGGIFAKSAKKRFFFVGPTTGVILMKSIHDNVFPELFHLPWFLGQLAFSVLLDGY